MESLSKDIIFNIGINLDLKDLLSFCTTSKHINSLLCRDIWLYNIKKYFPSLHPGVMNLYRNDRSWKQYYIQDLYRVQSQLYQTVKILLTSSRSGRVDLVICTLDLGVYAISDAFIIASIYGQYAVVKLLIEHGVNIKSRNEAVRYASQYGYYEIVKLLIDSGADIQTENNYAVRWANLNKHYDVVKLLIDYGAPDPRK